MEVTNMNLGENIYKFRTEKHMSQGDLADALEVSRQSVSKWENNAAVPELEKLAKLAELFGITIDELVTGTVPESPAEAPTEPKVIYIERTDHPGITPRQILGIVLTALASLSLLVSYLLIPENHWLDSPFPLCLPIAVCGIILIVAKHHPGYFCALTLYLLAWFPVTMLMTAHHGTMAWLVHGAIMVFGIILLIYTLLRFKSLGIHSAIKVIIMVTLVISLVIGLFGVLPPRELEAITWEEFISTVASASPD